MEERTQKTIDIWNEGFFGPRGVKIRLVGSESEKSLKGDVTNGSAREVTNGMPGAWVPYDNEVNGEPSRAPKGRRSWGLGSLGMRADSKGFKMGPIEANEDGFKLGNMLV